MKKHLLFFALCLLALVGTATAQNLKYGDVISLQNAWNSYAGGYLDTRGYQKEFAKTGNWLCVSTATGPNRDGGSGTWKVALAR